MEPHNPGLSEEAWKKLHRFIAKMLIKHGAKLAAKGVKAG